MRNALFTVMTIAVLPVFLAPTSMTHANTALSTSRVMPANGTSLNASTANDIVLAGGLGSDIEVDGSPAVSVTLSPDNVVGSHPYFGITPGPGSLSVNPEFVSNTGFHLQSEMDIYVKQ